MYRWPLCEKVDKINVVYVDDVLMASAIKRNEEVALKDPPSCFLVKDLGKQAHYLTYDITRDPRAGTFRVDQR